jgi:hypothetical protein
MRNWALGDSGLLKNSIRFVGNINVEGEGENNSVLDKQRCG